MQPAPEDTGRIIRLLGQAPLRLKESADGVQATRLTLRTELEPWSVGDILAHLRACSDVWGNSIMAMLAQDNPTRRYVSPRSFMKKPQYADREFDAALQSFTLERRKLVQRLATLDQSGWARRGTFTGTSSRQRDQTVWSYAKRLVNHELVHLDQIEALLA